MIRNFKALGLALVAMLALSAVVASAASAESDLTAGASSGTITATQAGEQVFTTTPGTVKCSTSHQEGTYGEATIKTMELSATYGGCKAFGFLSATVNMGTCKYHVAGAAEARTATVEIRCASGEITVTTTGCVIHVPPQKVTGHIVFDNEANDAKATYTFENIHYTETSGCPNVTLGTNPTTTNGTFTGSSTVIAKNTAGAQVSLVAD